MGLASEPGRAALRVLQVAAVDFTAYHFLAPLMRGCRDAGMTVEFACADGPWTAALEAEGFRYRPMPMSRARSPIAQVRAAAAFARSVREDRPDLIHTHTPIGGLVGRLGAFAVPQVPLAHTFHGLPLREDSRSLTERAFLRVERMLARRTSYFFSQASGDASRAIQLGVARREDLLVIGNGIDLARFVPNSAARAAMRAELGLSQDDMLVTTVGRLVREKGHLDLADAALACADLASMHVAIVGDALPSDRDPVTGTLDTHPAVARLGQRWHRLGHRADVQRVLQASDVFVLASYREGLPRTVIEAMATGLPVIATDIPACRELVEPGVVGLLVPPGRPADLAAAIRRLVTDARLRHDLGDLARDRAVARYDERDVVARQIPVLKRLARR